MRTTPNAASYRGKRLAVEESEVLVMVRIRFQMVWGRKGMASTHSTTKAGISFGRHRNTNTTAAQAIPTQLARE